MMQNVLRAMGGIENYGIISICLFFTVFITALIRALLQKKSFLNHMSALPLDDGESTTAPKGEKLS
jgi:hypothetical protein